MAQISLSEFADKIDEIMPAIMKEFLKNTSSKFYKSKVTMPQFVVMSIINRHGECRMTDLAREMGVTTAAVTGIIDRLVRDRFVSRSSDPADRRIIKVGLTHKGAGIVKNVMEERKRMTMKMFGMITRQERETYLDILTHIKEHIQK